VDVETQQVDPGHVATLCNFAYLSATVQDYTQAEQLLRRALASEPTVRVYMNMRKCLFFHVLLFMCVVFVCMRVNTYVYVCVNLHDVCVRLDACIRVNVHI
jgi:hypothetical protein